MMPQYTYEYSALALLNPGIARSKTTFYATPLNQRAETALIIIIHVSHTSCTSHKPPGHDAWPAKVFLLSCRNKQV